MFSFLDIRCGMWTKHAHNMWPFQGQRKWLERKNKICMANIILNATTPTVVIRTNQADKLIYDVLDFVRARYTRQSAINYVGMCLLRSGLCRNIRKMVVTEVLRVSWLTDWAPSIKLSQSDKKRVRVEYKQVGRKLVFDYLTVDLINFP